MRINRYADKQIDHYGTIRIDEYGNRQIYPKRLSGYLLYQLSVFLNKRISI